MKVLTGRKAYVGAHPFQTSSNCGETAFVTTIENPMVEFRGTLFRTAVTVNSPG